MLSISDNEFSVINYLVRDFSSRDTVRSMAKKLGFSPAGVYNILKKLEKEGIVRGEKFGTGLFYRMNFNNKAAKYLAMVVLVSVFDYSIDIRKHKEKSKAILFDKKNILFVVDNDVVESEFKIENYNSIIMKKEEFIEALRDRDKETLGILKNGNVLEGEEFVVDIIKRFVDRF